MYKPTIHTGRAEYSTDNPERASSRALYMTYGPVRAAPIGRFFDRRLRNRMEARGAAENAQIRLIFSG
jgi:hypothetical protein